MQELEAKYTGKELKVAILQASADTKKIVCSALKARENEALRLLEVGALVHGRVRRIEDYGVFVGIDGTRMSGLLHISNISRVHVEDPRVSRCFVLSSSFSF